MLVKDGQKLSGSQVRAILYKYQGSVSFDGSVFEDIEPSEVADLKDDDTMTARFGAFSPFTLHGQSDKGERVEIAFFGNRPKVEWVDVLTDSGTDDFVPIYDYMATV